MIPARHVWPTDDAGQGLPEDAVEERGDDGPPNALVWEVELDALSNRFAASQGMRISTREKAVTVKALGCYKIEGSAQKHTVGLYTTDSEYRKLGEVTVDLSKGPSGRFVYVDLPLPIVLAPRTSYFLMRQEYDFGDDWGVAASLNPSPRLRSLLSIDGPATMSYPGWRFDANPNTGSGPVNLMIQLPAQESLGKGD